jgi:hypothetical protein
MSAQEIACGGVPGQARTMVWLPADFAYPMTVAVGGGRDLSRAEWLALPDIVR